MSSSELRIAKSESVNREGKIGGTVRITNEQRESDLGVPIAMREFTGAAFRLRSKGINSLSQNGACIAWTGVP